MDSTTDSKQDPADAPIINPDLKKEIGGGLLYGGLFLLGMIISLAGLFGALINLLVGDIIWIVGTALMIFLLIRNIRSDQGKGFRIANIVSKCIALFISLIFIVLINIARLSHPY